MTEQIQAAVSSNVSVPSNEIKSEAVNSNQEIPKSLETPVQQTEQQKMLSQTEVNELVGRVKREAAEKARRDAIRELQTNIASQQISPQSPYQQSAQQMPQQPYYPASEVSQGNMQQALQQLPPDQVIRQTVQNMVQQAADDSIRNDFISLFANAKNKFSDFNFEAQDPRQDPFLSKWGLPVIQELNRLDDAADILHALGSDSRSLTTLTNLANTDPKRAIKDLKTYADSVRKNKTALSQPKAPEPIQPIKPSNTGTDNGSWSLQDLKKAPWLRG